MHLRLKAAPAGLALVLALAACSDDPATAPSAPAVPGTGRGAVVATALKTGLLATVESEGRRPALFIQRADGSERFRVRFVNVHDKIPGNWPAEMLPVTDDRILALGPAKWSPDGQQLAVIVTLGFDQSQVVVMNADGRNIRTASPNGQIILGDVDWAPDSRKIAYTMSTRPHAQAVDLFVTDLVKDDVQRITVDGRFGVFDEYRFDAASAGLWYTQFEGWAADGRNRLSRVYHASLAGQVDGVPTKLVGNPQGLSRDGGTALALRYTRDSWSVMEFVRTSLATGEETVLGMGELWYAELLEGDDAAVLVGASRATGGVGYFLVGIGAPDDVRGEVAVPKAAASMALLRASR